MGIEYCYWVTASNANGEGNKSNDVNIIPCSIPTPPLNLRLGELGGNYATVVWDKPVSDNGSAIIGYTIFRTDSLKSGILNQTVLDHKFEDFPLSVGKIYYYKVIAVNKIGKSIPSNELPVTLKGPTQPTPEGPRESVNTVPTIQKMGEPPVGDIFVNESIRAPAASVGENSILENVRAYLWAVLLLLAIAVVVVLYAMKKI